MKIYKIFCCLFILFLISCGGSKNIVEADEDFDVFYDKFDKNMDFQMERMQFPLEGGSAQVEGTDLWTRENWITMKVKIYDVDKTEYIVDYHKSENEFSQSFKLNGSGFSAEYRFKKINKKWYLVYALDTNL